MVLINELLDKLHKYKGDKKMEERIKLLEMQINVLQSTVNKMDQALGVMFQWALINKTFMDQLQVAKPTEVIKPEEAKK